MVTTITAVLGDTKNTQAYTFYSWFAESHFKPCNNNMCAMQILYQNKLGCNHLYENLFGAEKCCWKYPYQTPLRGRWVFQKNLKENI